MPKRARLFPLDVRPEQSVAFRRFVGRGSQITPNFRLTLARPMAGFDLRLDTRASLFFC